MTLRDRHRIEESLPASPDREQPVEDSADEWEYDAQILKTLAALSGTTPLNFLRKVSWSVGESTDTMPFRRGQPLSPAVRARLRSMLEERIQIEYEIIGNCRHASSQIVQLLPCFIGLTIISLLFF